MAGIADLFDLHVALDAVVDDGARAAGRTSTSTASPSHVPIWSGSEMVSTAHRTEVSRST
jgi:hypothetical protein